MQYSDQHILKYSPQKLNTFLKISLQKLVKQIETSYLTEAYVTYWQCMHTVSLQGLSVKHEMESKK